MDGPRRNAAARRRELAVAARTLRRHACRRLDGGCERQRERMRYMRELNARVHDPVKRVQAYADWDREWDSRHK